MVHNICNVGELAENLFSGLMVDGQKMCAEVVIPVIMHEIITGLQEEVFLLAAPPSAYMIYCVL